MSAEHDASREQELEQAGNELAARLEELCDEFGPAHLVAADDLGWDSVDAALSKWRRLVRRSAPA